MCAECVLLHIQQLGAALSLKCSLVLGHLCAFDGLRMKLKNHIPFFGIASRVALSVALIVLLIMHTHRLASPLCFSLPVTLFAFSSAVGFLKSKNTHLTFRSCHNSR